MFQAEAIKAHGFGAHHAARIFEACARTLPLAPRLHARIEGWPQDQAASALAFRLSGGLHALVRKGRAPGLRRLADFGWLATADPDASYDLAVAQALTDFEDELLPWLSHPTQTNEIGRVAGLMGVLAEMDARTPLGTELLELGASAGLNLNIARYSFDLGGTLLGPQDSVAIAPQWRGRAVPHAAVSVVAARGVDLAPLDVRRDDHCERLFAYTWPGMEQRTRRLGAAIALARRELPVVDTGNAGPWLAGRLSIAQPDGVRRVVFHSMLTQYMPQFERDLLAQTLRAAGQYATPTRPLLHVGMEWRADRSVVELRCTLWDGTLAQGREALVATCHPYAEWFDWRGLD